MGDTEEIQPCNTQSCERAACIDGQWRDWEEWEPCSATCKGGLTWRTRAVLAEANICGNPVLGDSRQEASCNSDVPCVADRDCVFSDWNAWSGCSKDCDGIMHRVRTVAIHG